LVGIVVERVLDVATLAVLLLAALVLLPSDDLVDDLATASAVLLVVIVAAAVLAARLRRRLRAPAARLLRRVPVFGGVRTERTLQSVARGSGAVLKPRVAGPALAWTLASWLALAVSNWCCMQAFSRDWPWHAALFVLIVTNLAMVVPATAARSASSRRRPGSRSPPTASGRARRCPTPSSSRLNLVPYIRARRRRAGPARPARPRPVAASRGDALRARRALIAGAAPTRPTRGPQTPSPAVRRPRKLAAS
jgi:hypothetical protein